MNAFAWQLSAALALDALCGDPRWLPHPVRLIGWFAGRLETVTRRAVPRPRVAGVLTALLVVGGSGVITWALLYGIAALHPAAGAVAAVLVMYTTLAARDLIVHSLRVKRRLDAPDLVGAREAVGMIVGRDTAELDVAGVARAAVESVAENLVDGVTAPLFWLCIGGPVGGIAFKAVSTLDSMFGYKNERYLEFGWAGARLDDLANWLPARLTAPLIALAALLLGQDWRASWRVMRRDCRRHASPNSGLSEAAFAGALGVQLGGPSTYGGRLSLKPTLGEAGRPLTSRDIGRANALLAVTTVLATALGLGLQAAGTALWLYYTGGKLI